MRAEHQLLQGPAIPAVLKLLETGSHSSHDLVLKLRTACPESLSQGEAAIVAVLHYLEGQRLVTSGWRETDAGSRRAYELTERGRVRLAEEARQCRSLVSLLAPAEEEPA